MGCISRGWNTDVRTYYPAHPREGGVPSRILEPRRPLAAMSQSAVWAGLNRLLTRAEARAGIRLVVGLPTSTVVISRFDGGNAGYPSPRTRPSSRPSRRISTGIGLIDCCG